MYAHSLVYLQAHTIHLLEGAQPHGCRIGSPKCLIQEQRCSISLQVQQSTKLHRALYEQANNPIQTSCSIIFKNFKWTLYSGHWVCSSHAVAYAQLRHWARLTYFHLALLLPLGLIDSKGSSSDFAELRDLKFRASLVILLTALGHLSPSNLRAIQAWFAQPTMFRDWSRVWGSQLMFWCQSRF